MASAPGAQPSTASPVAHGRAGRLWGRAFAAIYDPVMRQSERSGNADRRRELLRDARGTVLELGAGTGANLEHYPDGVELVLTEPEGPMARRLREHVAQRRPGARVIEAAAERLPLPDASVDTVVATLVLCTVGDLGAALAEIRRVLRPDGHLLFLEHVASEPGTRERRIQDAIERPWHALAHGCHTNRETVAALQAAGFAVDDLRRDRLGGLLLTAPLVWGRAHVAAG
ncbi:MAG TPA: class I SAM-dependent methyltransferase [Baekduia sp.]|nr:class I SAM-dependent methyltransferase [Baekduia sp.]